MDVQPFQGRVAMVAGASKGIGAATAEAFAAAGARWCWARGISSR